MCVYICVCIHIDMYMHKLSISLSLYLSSICLSVGKSGIKIWAILKFLLGFLVRLIFTIPFFLLDTLFGNYVQYDF